MGDITWQQPGLSELDQNPNPGRSFSTPRGGYYRDGKYWAKRMCVAPYDTEVRLPEHIERWRCGYTKSDGTGDACQRWSCVAKINGKWQSLALCPVHMKKARRKDFEGRELTLELGKNGLYSRVFPQDLRTKLALIIDTNETRSLVSEIGLVKLLLERFLENKASEVDQEGKRGVDDMSTLAVVSKVSSLLANLTKTQADIDKQRENMMDIKQILVLLDAACNYLIKKFGKNTDARNLLLEMLPELPWPQGIARVSGAEGLIGRRGNLLLAKPREEQATPEVTANWSALDKNYRPDDNQMDVVTADAVVLPERENPERDSARVENVRVENGENPERETNAAPTASNLSDRFEPVDSDRVPDREPEY